MLETGLDALGGAEALQRLSECSDDEVDKTMELFLVEFQKACRLPYVVVEKVEKLARSEVAAKEGMQESETLLGQGEQPGGDVTKKRRRQKRSQGRQRRNGQNR